MGRFDSRKTSKIRRREAQTHKKERLQRRADAVRLERKGK